MPTQRRSETTFIPAYSDRTPAPLPAPRQEMRPTFEGQSGAGRLLLFFVFAILAAAAAHFLADIARLPALLLGLLLLLALWAVDLSFATGFVHKVLEQRTEGRRIDAAQDSALASLAAINEAQDEQMSILWDEIQKIHARFDAMETISIGDRGGQVRKVSRVDTADLRIRQWLTTEIFNSHGTMIGVHPNGQLKRTVPFKETSAADDDKAAYRRLVGAGLLGRNGSNYVWIGPQTLPLAMEKLSRLGGQGGG